MMYEVRCTRVLTCTGFGRYDVGGTNYDVRVIKYDFLSEVKFRDLIRLVYDGN